MKIILDMLLRFSLIFLGITISVVRADLPDSFPQLYNIGSLGTITNITDQIFYSDKNSSISLEKNFPVDFYKIYPTYYFADWGTYNSSTNTYEISFSSADNLMKILVNLQAQPASLDIYGKVMIRFC